MEDADGDIVPGVLSFGPHPVCWACGERVGSYIFTGTVLCWGEVGPVRAGVCGDWGGVGSNVFAKK